MKEEEEESIQSPADMEVDEIDQALGLDQETRSAKKRKRSDDNPTTDESDFISPDDEDSTKRLKVCVVHLPETLANGGDAGEILSQVLAQDVLSAEDTSIVRNILERRQSIDESSIRQSHAPTDAPSEIDTFHISTDEIPHTSELSPPHQTRSRSSSLALVIIPSRHSHVDSNENQENRIDRQDSSRLVLDCAVCHADVDFSEPGSYCILPCRHAYHQSCIKPWFQTQLNYHNDIDCPRCRRVIPYNRRSTTIGIGGEGIQVREEGHDLPQAVAQPSSDATPNAEATESNFLVDNDLLPSPSPLRTERQIIDDFFVRLQRRNWDPTTKVIISTDLLALNGGLIVGGFGGAMLGALIALLWRYNLGHRVLGRLVGEILSTAFVIGSDALPPTHWAARTLRFLLISSVFLGHLSVMHAISSAAGSSDDVFTQTASYVNIIMVLIMFSGRLQSKLARLLASALLQFALAYVMIFCLRNLSIWEDLFFGFAQHLVFVAVRHP